MNYVGKDPYELITNPKIPERAALLSANPVAATRAFHVLMQAFLEFLVGYPSTFGRNQIVERKRGIFGMINAYFNIFEVQGRGVLHMHRLFFGLLDPRIAQKCCHDEKLRKSFC